MREIKPECCECDSAMVQTKQEYIDVWYECDAGNRHRSKGEKGKGEGNGERKEEMEEGRRVTWR